MKRAIFFAAVAVVFGLFTTHAFARDPYSRRFTDDQANALTVGYPGGHHGHHGQGSYDRPRYGGHDYSYGYRYRVPPYGYRSPLYGPPAVIYPFPGHPPVVHPPIYQGGRHVCGPSCGCCRYPDPYNNFYYRGNGWGFSFGF